MILLSLTQKLRIQVTEVDLSRFPCILDTNKKPPGQVHAIEFFTVVLEDEQSQSSNKGVNLV